MTRAAALLTAVFYSYFKSKPGTFFVPPPSQLWVKQCTVMVSLTAEKIEPLFMPLTDAVYGKGSTDMNRSFWSLVRRVVNPHY